MHKLKKLLEKHTSSYYFLLNVVRSIKEFYLKYCISDQKLLKKLYQKRIGNKLNIEKPKTYNEKLQYLKLKQVEDKFKIMSDKYKVRDYTKQKIGRDISPQLHWVGENPNKIPFDRLPSSFVLKTNHNSGPVIIVRNKNDLSKKNVKKEIDRQMKENYYLYKREYNYKGIIKKILVEELLLTSDGKIPEDYKFFCFDGKIKLIQVDIDRYGEHKQNFYDLHWKFQDIKIYLPNDKTRISAKPKNFDEMVNICKKLSKGLPHVRIDLYNIDGRIYLGEMTFYHQSGMQKFIDKDLALQMGQWINLND